MTFSPSKFHLVKSSSLFQPIKVDLEPYSFTLFSNSLLDFVSSETLINVLSPFRFSLFIFFLTLNRIFSEVGFVEEDEAKLE